MATTNEEPLTRELKAEIERLSQELDQASTEKIQSAQYGLALLEEKCTLEQRCGELEGLYETARHELEITQEVRHQFLHLFYLSHINLFLLILFFPNWQRSRDHGVVQGWSRLFLDFRFLLQNLNESFSIDFQALAKFQTTTKLTTKSGIEQEESLLSESAARENFLQDHILELENEAKQVKLASRIVHYFFSNL